MDINFRRNRKNSYSLAALTPLFPDAQMVKKPENGLMIYSFASRQKTPVFREVENASTDSVFIAGGPHPSGAPEETLSYFDYVVIGEGEQTLPELVKALRSGKDTSKVKGIAYKDVTGNPVFTENRGPVDLDMYPCFDPDRLMAPLEISRGCPFRCKYCQTPRIFGGKVRHRSIDSIVKFAQYYNDLRFTSSNALAYGSDGIHPRFDKVEKLLSSLHRIDGKKIYFGTFPSEVRPEFITEESIEMITKYCDNTRLNLGAQSGSDRILKEIWRGHTTEDTFRGIELCFKHGIIPVVDFIVGYPDETEEEQDKSLEMIKWISKKGGNVHAHYLTPLPGTPYEHAIPSVVSDRFKKVLGKMALEGKATGSWS
ncbi:TIGR04013 family B12-binding domain/radical SAM domain-containing protein [Methanolobus halotolerans]|uniref:TIGR04013 family B12-binding domain/radical SAM domain-containing protein n=1 Tax=Methanolobus halotolerans TaxID=2052935 RepID=A0A4E0QTJ0_9EURY|nr:TIGR04013 family B12-binding domain/radical SAM domain-containing protein [Methanolobus halotolerans]TGC11171.1 TIGR04013 family B12-binding domain/radical SAM domain-containing protein [Methanolobus halotolerans]